MEERVEVARGLGELVRHLELDGGLEWLVPGGRLLVAGLGHQALVVGEEGGVRPDSGLAGGPGLALHGEGGHLLGELLDLEVSLGELCVEVEVEHVF